MALEVVVTSDKKGSNPGGKVRILGRGSFEGYLKYCPGSKLFHNQYFSAQNQPVYEAITFEMARKLGLQTPDFFVLTANQGLQFTFEKGVTAKIGTNRKSYFVSKIVSIPESEDAKARGERMDAESIYRDLLRIADIEGKKQNYLFLEPTRSLVYLDLGCSFVHAVGGFLQLKNVESKALSASDKEVRAALAHLDRYHLILNDNQTTMRLSEVVSMPHNLRIPLLNPLRRESLNDLISAEEINNIVKILTISVYSHLKRIQESPLVLKE